MSGTDYESVPDTFSVPGLLDSSATDITIYKWNEENELTAVTPYDNYADYVAGTGGVETQFADDPFGNMVSETTGGATEYLIYDGQNVVLDFNGSGTLIQRQLNGPAVNQVLAVEEVGGENPGVNWLLADAQGSVRDVVRGTYSDGATTTAAVDHVFLDAFGDQSTPQTASDSQEQTQIGFAGMRYIAAVELYLTPNRPYDPSTGDWLQPDPAGFDAGQTNLFEYCGNSPTNATDPSGLMANYGQGSSANWGPLKGTDIGGVGNCGCATGVQVGIPDDSGGGTPVMYEEQPGTLPPLLPDAPGKQNNVWTPDSIRSLILSTPEGKLLVKKAESQFPDGVHMILKDVGANAASEATAPPEGMVEPGSNGTLYGHLGDIWLRPGISKSQAVQGLLFEYGNLSQRHEQADNEARGQKKTVTEKDKKDFIKMALIIELRNIVDEIDIYEKYQNQWGCDEKLNLPTDEGMIPAVRKGGQSLETYAQKQIELYDLAPSKSPFQNNIGQYYRNWNDFRQKAKL